MRVWDTMQKAASSFTFVQGFMGDFDFEDTKEPLAIEYAFCTTSASSCGVIPSNVNLGSEPQLVGQVI